MVITLDEKSGIQEPCKHTLWDRDEPFSSFWKILIHSNKVFRGRNAMCSKCGCRVSRSSKLIRLQGFPFGIFIPVGLGFFIGRSNFPLAYVGLVILPVAFVLYLIQVVAAIVIPWHEAPKLEYTKNYIEFIRTERMMFEKGVSHGILTYFIVCMLLVIFNAIGNLK